VFRQARESRIVRAAYQVHAGQVPESASPDRPGDFYFIPAETPERIQELLVSARDLWTMLPTIEDEADRWAATRLTFRLIHLADIETVTTAA